MARITLWCARMVGAGVLCTVAVLLASGCEEPVADDDTNTGTDRDAFALAMAEALCAGAVPCCAEYERDAPSEDCEVAVRDEVFIAILTAEQEQRTVDLDGADACVETFSSSLQAADDCAELPHPELLVSLCPELFSAIPEGSLAPGEPCAGTFECSTPELGEQSCYRANFNEASLCTWFVPTAADEPCQPSAGIVPVCAEGLGCSPVEVSADELELRCTAPRAFGEPCFDASSCEPGYACSLQVSGSFSCVDELAPGNPCEAQPDACGAQYFCELPQSTCEKLPIFKDCMGNQCLGELNTYCR